MNASDEEGLALLCRCLASVSMADGELDGREIATQMSIIEQITQTPISADAIVAATFDVEDWDAFKITLEAIGDSIEPSFRSQILKACILVGRADDLMIDAEVERIYGVAEAFGFSRQEVDEEFRVIR